ncbi:LacI family transcriptional regulator [Saccharopolyspora rhizosphaerae]|uniref:LacI family transcriptional regulator n=1 Tax=Saccharopolyspora rhizosphaerae TaxID=2492662 RepID=A0A426K4U4_9PSEU|nr:LacI family DNA-binding transcriptional regulator [Saccharopolyspora rhizosphaerae]RRO20333.1 LacI family transcriptional regulator [Saccharopolyspora rhizosphaerae]
MVTSRDVARLAGVSQMTVSRVLQDSGKVAPQTRARVLAAMREAGYRPHAAARTMRTRRTSTVGVVVADITNPFYPQLLEAVTEALDAADQRMVLWNGPDGSGALESLDEGTVDGLIFTTVTEATPQLTDAVERADPIVLLHRGLDELDCDQVTTDNAAGGRAVAEYLVTAGHTRIGFVSGPELPSTARHREQGFRERLAELGHPLADELTSPGGFAHDVARSAMRRLLELESPPTAVFCANDLTALGAVDGAVSLGRRVPEDVWVVGYDDIALTAWDSYDVTTVRQPIAEMARASVRLLLERIGDRGLPPRKECFSSELVVRGSTARTARPAV